MVIHAYTDGSCLGNPGVSGYAAVMVSGDKIRKCYGYSARQDETNNRAELMAVITAVKWIDSHQKTPCEIIVHTDSQYIMSCYPHKRSWLTAESRKNNDLWLELITIGLKGKHRIKFIKVKGHDGVTYNEEADKLAKSQAVKARHELYGG